MKRFVVVTNPATRNDKQAYPLGVIFGKKDVERFKLERKDVIDQYVIKKVDEDDPNMMTISDQMTEAIECCGLLAFESEIETMVHNVNVDITCNMITGSTLEIIRSLPFIKISEAEKEIIIRALGQINGFIDFAIEDITNVAHAAYDGFGPDIEEWDIENKYFDVVRYLKETW